MPAHTSSFFSGALLSVGLGVVTGLLAVSGSAPNTRSNSSCVGGLYTYSGLVSVGGVGVTVGLDGADGIDGVISVFGEVKYFPKRFCTRSFIKARSIVFLMFSGSNSSPRVSALVNLCCPSPDSLNFSLTLLLGLYTYSIPLSVQFLRKSSKLLL